MDFINHSYLIILIPLIGAFINGALSFAGVRPPKWVTNIFACGSIGAAFVVAVGVFLELSKLAPESRSITVNILTWFDLASLKANIALLIDPLSVVMALVVTGVGSLIHIYSIGYMAEDPGYGRFFSYLNLFCFAMLTLVLADNLLLMFVGWEGVGLCSYLLIGFWFDHKPNAMAGMKAFIVNRIGDFGFLLGLMILFWAFAAAGHPTVTFTELREHAHILAAPVVTIVCILFFVGATGKSAQIPLYVWLPDAMAGPTPVSALIHAATMVTAGVYMIGRLNFLYTMSPIALAVVATVGAITAVFAATIGFAQNDIKKVLAYSTVSQLGYMFLGMGTGIYSAGIFHLVTHAFFKACLFLGAGSVILGMHHEQDIQKMGGLRKYMPVTFVTFFAATLALSGVFPLAGFFSKDEILWQSFSHAGFGTLYHILWGLGLAGAFGTAFYMFRCVSLTFFGNLRTSKEHEQEEAGVLDKKHHHDSHHKPLHPHESPAVITVVLAVLAVLSVVGGFLGVPHAIGKFIHLPNYFEYWLAPVFEPHGAVVEHVVEGAVSAHGGSAEYVLMIVSTVVAFTGILLAVWLFTKRRDLVKKFTSKFALLHKIVFNKYYVDEIYNAVFVQPLLKLNDFLKKFDQVVIDGAVNLTATVSVLWARFTGWWDWTFIDGAVNLVANATIYSGKKLRLVQTGKIEQYIYIVLFGLISVLIWRVM